MLVGRVKIFLADQGFGFIKPQEGQGTTTDRFFHLRECFGFTPKSGDEVTFDLAERKGRMSAVKVRLRGWVDPNDLSQPVDTDGGLLKFLGVRKDEQR